MKKIENICDICGGEIEVKRHPETGEVYWTHGHNAEPVVEEGRCCDTCNDIKVIPARLRRCGFSNSDAAAAGKALAKANKIGARANKPNPMIGITSTEGKK